MAFCQSGCGEAATRSAKVIWGCDVLVVLGGVLAGAGALAGVSVGSVLGWAAGGLFGVVGPASACFDLSPMLRFASVLALLGMAPHLDHPSMLVMERMVSLPRA